MTVLFIYSFHSSFYLTSKTISFKWLHQTTLNLNFAKFQYPIKLCTEKLPSSFYLELSLLNPTKRQNCWLVRTSNSPKYCRWTRIWCVLPVFGKPIRQILKRNYKKFIDVIINDLTKLNWNTVSFLSILTLAFNNKLTWLPVVMLWWHQECPCCSSWMN